VRRLERWHGFGNILDLHRADHQLLIDHNVLVDDHFLLRDHVLPPDHHQLLGRQQRLRQAFDSALRQSLVQQGDLTSAQIDCVLNELHRTLPDSQIQASTPKRVPKAVIDAASQAGLQCANP
jgi:hypothetical protein